MKLIKTDRFIKESSKLTKRNAELEAKLTETLKKLESNPFDQSLFTHKLKGELQGRLSARLTYDLKIIFSIVKEQNEDCILLLTIGSHDEVY